MYTVEINRDGKWEDFRSFSDLQTAMRYAKKAEEVTERKVRITEK